MTEIEKYKNYAVAMLVGTTGDFKGRAEGVLEAFCGALEMNNYEIKRKPPPPASSAEIKMLYWALREYTEKHLDDTEKAQELHAVWSKIVEGMRA